MKYKAVIFDMDGVIFDSERLVLESWKQIAEKYGIQNVEEVLIKCIGVNAVITRDIFLEYYGKDFPYDMYKTECSSLFHTWCKTKGLPIKKGVTELLEYLNDSGYKVGLASSTRYEIVKEELEEAGLLPYFHNLTGGDMLKKSKPEPDIFLMACESLSVKPEEAIGIEDSYNGIRALSRAGMLPVMVPDMIAPDEEMKDFAEFIFDDLLEVLKWIQTSRGI